MSQADLKTVSLSKPSQWGFDPRILIEADRFDNVNSTTLRLLVHDIAVANTARSPEKREKWIAAATKVLSTVVVEERRAGLREVILAMGKEEDALAFQRSNPETTPALCELGSQLGRFLAW